MNCFAVLDELEWLSDELHAAKDPGDQIWYGSQIYLTIKLLRKLERILGGPFAKVGDGSFDGLNVEILKSLKNANDV